MVRLNAPGAIVGAWLSVVEPAAGPVTRLTQGQALEREMAAGETHRYSVELRAGEYLQLLVEQRGVDVVQTLSGPDGAVVLEVSSPSAVIGPDPLAVVAAQTGLYTLSLTPEAISIPPRGRYEIRLEAIREPSARDLARVTAVRALADGRRWLREDPRTSREHYRVARDGFEAGGDRRMQMWTELMVGVGHAAGLDQYKEAVEWYRRSLATALELGGRVRRGSRPVQPDDLASVPGPGG